MLPVYNNYQRKPRRERRIYPYHRTAPKWVGWAVVGVLAALLAVSATLWVHRFGHASASAKPLTESRAALSRKHGTGKLCSYPGRTISYARTFNADNATHLAAATTKGIKPCATVKDVDRQKARLRKIRTNHNFVVDDLEHSVPYLTIAAANELDQIGKAFADILDRNDCPHYRFIVTSVLRTDESVRKLRRSGNVNASQNSAHCYATTFDISYRRFDKNDRSSDYMTEENLKLALAQVLLNEQRAGHIYVKYEHRQACFHITSRL